MLYNAWPVIITALLHALLCLSTYSTTQTHTHTHIHPAPCVNSHILYSSTLTRVECMLSNSRPDEVEAKTERKTENVKDTERRKLVKRTLMQRQRICMII